MVQCFLSNIIKCSFLLERAILDRQHQTQSQKGTYAIKMQHGYNSCTHSFVIRFMPSSKLFSFSNHFNFNSAIIPSFSKTPKFSSFISATMSTTVSTPNDTKTHHLQVQPLLLFQISLFVAFIIKTKLCFLS